MLGCVQIQKRKKVGLIERAKSHDGITRPIKSCSEERDEFAERAERVRNRVVS
jgi:hypothetical protein